MFQLCEFDRFANRKVAGHRALTSELVAHTPWARLNLSEEELLQLLDDDFLIFAARGDSTGIR